MNDLALLQLARVKGLISSEAASAALDTDTGAVGSAFEQFRDKGWLVNTARGWRLTPAGRNTAAMLVEEERASLDAGALRALYEEFCNVNSELKSTMTAWQLHADGAPNDHTDAAYDQAVTARLGRLHERAEPLVDRIGQAAPRLAHYRRRLSTALENIRRGDAAYVARPIVDSYHTVWFELHEDLMAINGLTRAAEAHAGRAQ
jgi:pyruvate, orthophosphate dikinase